MNDFLEWPMTRQATIVHEVCKILEEHHIPYVLNKMNRPARSLTLTAPCCDAQALMAVYIEQDRIIDELRTELFKLRAEENGVQWHDLREDPNDLPTDYRSVWTNQGGAYYDVEDKRWADGDSWVYNVIAWCEPQFKE